jgi:hypothetical protein
LPEQVVLFCGQAAITLRDIDEINFWFDSHPLPPSPLPVSFADWQYLTRGLKFALGKPMTIILMIVRLNGLLSSEQPYSAAWRIFRRACRLAATDPRDKIYSLLGLVKIGIDVDYSKPVESLYREVAGVMFERVAMHEWFQGIDVSFESRMSALPTWVIDWDAPNKGCGWINPSQTNLYDAAAAIYNASNSIEIKGDVLTLSGTIFDEVNCLAPLQDSIESKNAAAFQFDITGGESSGEVLYDSIPPGIPRGQASLRLYLGDRELSGEGPFTVNSTYLDLSMRFIASLMISPKRMYEEDARRFLRLFFGDITALQSSFVENFHIKQGRRHNLSLEMFQDFVIRTSEHTVMARHFYTRKSYLGFGPRWVQEGDLVCVLQGCRLPVLLRKVDDYYHFISTCFVLGLMNGEAAEMLNRGEIVMQQFAIH